MNKKIKTLVAILALIAILSSAFSGCSKYAPKDKDEDEDDKTSSSNQKDDQDQDDDDSPSIQISTLKGNDIFAGEHCSEMIWGYYEADCYDYNGSNEDANEFLTDMEFITVSTERGDYEFAALPLSMQAGKYSHFMDSFLYEGEYYEPYTETGKSMFRKAYIAEQGDMTEEQFRKMEYIMELDVVDLTLAFRNGSTYIITLAYTLQDNSISLYGFSVDDDYNIAIENDPYVTLDFLHSGSKLTLAYQGVQRDYLASGLKETDPSFTCSGFALNEDQKYEDLEGFSFYQYGAEDDLSVYIDLTNGDSPIDPVMEFDPDTCEFSLSWQECWTTSSGGIDRVADPRTISGKLVPCTNYGFTDYTGFFLFIDGNCYHYLMSQKEFDERMYSNILGDNASYEDFTDSQLDEFAAAKTSILEELKKALDEAGIPAEIDTVSGKVTLEATFLFATNSSEVSPDGQDYLNRFIDVYTSVVLDGTYGDYISNIIVEGHTDTSGSYSLNQTLSEDRANAVADHCITLNPALINVIQTKGCSYDFPIYNTDGSVNMERSRRVTFSFVFASN